MNDDISEYDEHDDDCFYCDACNKRFRSPLYDVTKDFERTIFFDEPLIPEIDIMGAESIAYFCSPSCRDKKRDQLLTQEDIRATYPEIGPIESCSRCGAPVDMTEFHLAFVEMDTTHDWDRPLLGAKVINDPVTLAVICQKCEPIPRQIKAAIEQDMPDYEPTTQPVADGSSPNKTIAAG